MYADARVLVTGGSGFIGRHLIQQLQQRGASVSTISRKRGPFPKDVIQYPIDIRSREEIQACLRDCRPEYIFHLAGYKERDESPGAFYSSIETNLLGSLNLLTVAKEDSRIKSIIALGTVEEYGRNRTPFNESLRECPVTPYSFSKLCVSHLSALFHQLYHLPVIIIRPTLAYGPGQAEDMFLPALIMALKENRPFAMTAGEQTRDFIYIEDLVDAILVACGKEQLHGQILNIGSGKAHKLAQVATLAERMLERKGLVQLGAVPYRKNEIMSYAVSLDKAKQILGWSPKVQLEDGLKKTIAFYCGV